MLGDELVAALDKRDESAFESLATVSGFSEVVRNFIENPPRSEGGTIDSAQLTALASFSGRLQRDSQDPMLWPRLWSAWKGAASEADYLAASAIAGFLDAVPDEAKRDASFLASRVVTQALLPA